jgi:hypothetical protein
MSQFRTGIVAGVCLLVMTAFTIAAEITETSLIHQYHPTLKAHRVNGRIEIDGQLSDPGWQGAHRATNFTEHSPGQEVAPPVRTEALVAYDENNLYLAAICYADPGTVRASLCERERIFDDDNIGFFFDTYGDATRAYIININPYGIQYDALWSAGWGEDSNFDMVFYSRGVVTDSGYQVEVAIPFANLRFPTKPVQEWKIDFYRHHQREVHYSMSWATYDQDEPCWPCRWGTVTGIENVKPGKGIKLLPSFVAHQSGSVGNETFPDTSFANGDIYGDLSIGGKYALSSNAVVEATYNPDFSQIEADASQVDVNTTFALSYDEKRPFFQEGIDVFRTNFNAVYTRSVNDPDFAAKASAKFGRTSVAVLTAHDERNLNIMPFEEWSAYVPIGETYTSLMAVRHAFGDDNHVRALITDQRIDGGGSGTLTSLDGWLSLTKSLAARGQFMATHTAEPDDISLTGDMDGYTFDDDKHTAAFDGESYWGTGALIGMTYQAQDLYINVRGYQRTPTYRAASGFQPQNNDRRVIAYGSWSFHPSGWIMHSIDQSIELGRLWNYDGLRKDEWVRLWAGNQYRFAQSEAWVEYLRSRERFSGIDFRDIWAVSFGGYTRPAALAEFSLSMTYGNIIARNYLEMGRQTSISLAADLHPSERLLLEPEVDYVISRSTATDEKYFEGYIARTRVSYQFSRELSLRLVTEYNDFRERWSVDPLITYRINPFSTFYAGATYDYDRYYDCGVDMTRTLTCLSQRQFFIKLQYLFQT